jgi:hypothetical protein
MVTSLTVPFVTRTEKPELSKEFEASVQTNCWPKFRLMVGHLLVALGKPKEQACEHEPSPMVKKEARRAMKAVHRSMEKERSIICSLGTSETWMGENVLTYGREAGEKSIINSVSPLYTTSIQVYPGTESKKGVLSPSIRRPILQIRGKQATSGAQ